MKSAMNSSQSARPGSPRKQVANPFEATAAQAPRVLRIPGRPKIGSPRAPQTQETARSPYEGGTQIPTLTEAYAQQEQQFFAQRKAEFDSILEKASVKEQNEIEHAKATIKNEIKKLEHMNMQMNEKLSVLQKVALENGGKKGVYYVRFMELMVELLRTLAAQVGESNTWLDAMISKKKKRGSLFATQSKSHGTQYSMSQEHSIARSTN